MLDALYFTDSDEANALLARDPLALLVGFALDQQVPVPIAFLGPLKLRERVGTLDARAIAELDPGELEAAEAFGAEILKLCVRVGGVLTGEHGVGVEKRDLMGEMFSESDLNQQQRVKCAFDERSLLNPGKVFPTLHRCAELGRMHISAGRLPFPDLPRF